MLMWGFALDWAQEIRDQGDVVLRGAGPYVPLSRLIMEMAESGRYVLSSV